MPFAEHECGNTAVEYQDLTVSHCPHGHCDGMNFTSQIAVRHAKTALMKVLDTLFDAGMKGVPVVGRPDFDFVEQRRAFFTRGRRNDRAPHGRPDDRVAQANVGRMAHGRGAAAAFQVHHVESVTHAK
ncbi:hypothetical protein D3C76_1139100 [compost metagenome]